MYNYSCFFVLNVVHYSQGQYFTKSNNSGFYNGSVGFKFNTIFATVSNSEYTIKGNENDLKNGEEVVDWDPVIWGQNRTYSLFDIQGQMANRSPGITSKKHGWKNFWPLFIF